MSLIISLRTDLELFITVLNKSSKELTECRISVKVSQETNSYPDIHLYTSTSIHLFPENNPDVHCQLVITLDFHTP